MLLPGTDSDEPEIRLAATIVELTRELARSTPAPKAAPFFGLDSDQPYDLSVLEDLSAPGIFRKYELVLLLHSGFGGSARWLSRRLACRVLGVDSDVARVRAAQRLSKRAGMAEQASFAASHAGQLAFGDCVFTHVWIVDPPPAYCSNAALREAFRVLRRGGHCALHTTGARDGELEAALGDAGFVDIKVRHVRLAPPGHVASAARARLRQMLEGHDTLEKLAAATAGTDPWCAQIFCRRE